MHHVHGLFALLIAGTLLVALLRDRPQPTRAAGGRRSTDRL